MTKNVMNQGDVGHGRVSRWMCRGVIHGMVWMKHDDNSSGILYNTINYSNLILIRRIA